VLSRLLQGLWRCLRWIAGFSRDTSQAERCSGIAPGTAPVAVQAHHNAAGSAVVRSRIARWDAPDGGRLFWMRNVAIDFGRMGTWWGGSSRYFSPGFVEAACDAASPRELGGPGLEFYADQAEAGLQGFKLLDGSADAVYCDEWVHTPTLVVQHDDIGNLWHNYMDHWRVWVALAILQQPACVPSYGHVGAVRLPRNGGGMEDRSATEEGGTLLRRSRSQRRSDADPGAADAADGSFCPAPAAASTWWPRGDASDLDSRSSASLQAMCQPGEHLVLGLNPDEMQVR
jgi:hypothetical protein